MSGNPSSWKENKSVIGIFAITVLFFGFGIYIYYALDDSMDFSILHNEIMNNQTFVDEMTCDKIVKSKNALAVLISPNQQDEVEQLRIDFDRLYQEKRCEGQ